MNVYKFIVAKPGRKTLSWEDNIKMNLEGIQYERMDWTNFIKAGEQ
jgi:hypothetical protein